MEFNWIVPMVVWLAQAAGSSLLAKDGGDYALKEGDIVFSSSTVGQGAAIIEATASPYTHCGIVYEKDGRLMVLEAVQLVGLVTLEEFIARGRPEVFMARRLREPLAPGAYQKARAWAAARIGGDYDAKFRWDDGKLYCSELVWKIYQKAGVELCPLRKFRDYDLQRPAVRKMIDERYGGIGRLPLDETVVAPSDLAASPLLGEVPERSPQ